VSVVAVVGGAGLVGRALCASLAARGHRVVVVDRVRADVVVDLAGRVDDAVLDAAFVDVAAVVHLAAQVNPPRDRRERWQMRQLHEDGTAAVARAARRAGVARLVLCSSAVVYGAWPNNPVPLDESAPVRPCPGFAYAVDKAIQEHVARLEFGPALTVVRPAIVYGRGAKSYLTEILRNARLPRRVGLPGILPALDGHRPPLQFVHVDDVAAVLAACVDVAAAAGAVVNAAAADFLAYEDVASAAGLVVKDVDAAIVGRALDVLVPLLPPALRAPSALFPYLMHPFVLSADKARRLLGVTTRTSAEALATLWE
jgi:UDP-glucose 4-epimerase